jgi:uncharacterized protein YqjF (DUF2071 family)
MVLVAQRWERLLFAHWPADPAAVGALLPRGVEPDVRDGRAWVALVAFVMTRTRSPLAPAVRLASIPELNVRTYVRVGGIPAVWFLSLDAASPFFANLGRALYGLRYHIADMTAVADGARVHYLSNRGGAMFAATYAPVGAPARAAKGTLEHFLVERYRLFAERAGQLVTATVAHEPWPLQRARARIDVNRMAPPGIDLDGPPLLHYAHAVDATISAPAPVAARDRVTYALTQFSRRKEVRTHA